MPREKQGKRKPKGAPLPIVSTLQKFLKTYEKHCVQTQTSACPAIKRDLKASINHERILRKFVLVRPDDSPPDILPISLEPLLMTVRDECYMLGREICIWGFKLSNPEIARLALLLESKGHTPCPFTALELIDCKMDPWSLGRLGQALRLSSLHVLVLDYCKFTHEEIESIFSGLENNQRLQSLSLRLLWSGATEWTKARHHRMLQYHLNVTEGKNVLRPMLRKAQTFDFLSCSVSYSQAPSNFLPEVGTEAFCCRPPRSPTERKFNFEPDYRIIRSCNSENYLREEEKKRNQEKIKDLIETGPWLVKLYLADNGIDGKGKEGENDLLEFTQILTCLIKYSAHLKEIDLGNNVLGEKAAVDLLEALRARKTEPDIVESEVKWALGSTAANKASGCDEIPAELFKTLMDDVIKVLYSLC